MSVDFRNVKVGDVVAMHSPSVGGMVRPVRKVVTKVTATQIEVDGGLRFMRSHGREFGADRYYQHSIEPWTNEVNERIAAAAERAALALRNEDVMERLKDAYRAALAGRDRYGHVFTAAQLDDLEALSLRIREMSAAVAASWSAEGVKP